MADKTPIHMMPVPFRIRRNYRHINMAFWNDSLIGIIQTQPRKKALKCAFRGGNSPEADSRFMDWIACVVNEIRKDNEK